MELQSYFKTVFIDSAHADCFGVLRPSALLEIMQEAAGEHAEVLGCGREMTVQKGLFWAIVRQTIEITRLPRVGETLVVETWPGKPSRTAFPRHMVGRTQEGRELFRAVALWLFMDLETRSMVLPAACGIDIPGTERQGQLPNPTGLALKLGEPKQLRTVQYSELDWNGHMSNTKYLNWLEDLMPAQWHKAHTLKRLQINYVSEALEGQKIALAYTLEDGVLSLEGRREEPAGRVFALKALYDEG